MPDSDSPVSSGSSERFLPPELLPPQEQFREDMLMRLEQSRMDSGFFPGAIGKLKDIAAWLAACQGVSPARDLGEVELLIVSSDSDLAASALPRGYSAQLADMLREGTLTLVDTAQQAGAQVRFVNADEHAPQGPIDQLNEQEFELLINFGRSLADDAADRGVDMLLLGDLGRGMTTASAAVVGTICSIEPVSIVGRGSGIDDSGWKSKIALVRDAMFRVRDDRGVADRVLRRAGNPAIVVLCGVMIQAAQRRTPVLFEGAGTSAAGLCAQMLCPGASDWWLAASIGSEPCEKAALSALQLTPMLDIGVATGAGVGTLLALPLVRQAVTLTSGSGNQGS